MYLNVAVLEINLQFACNQTVLFDVTVLINFSLYESRRISAVNTTSAFISH